MTATASPVGTRAAVPLHRPAQPAACPLAVLCPAPPRCLQLEPQWRRAPPGAAPGSPRSRRCSAALLPRDRPRAAAAGHDRPRLAPWPQRPLAFGGSDAASFLPALATPLHCQHCRTCFLSCCRSLKCAPPFCFAAPPSPLAALCRPLGAILLPPPPHSTLLQDAAQATSDLWRRGGKWNGGSAHSVVGVQGRGDPGRSRLRVVQSGGARDPSSRAERRRA